MFAFGHNHEPSVHALPTARVACVARPILVGVSNARAHQPVRISFGASCDRARRPWHVSALRARACRWGGGILFAHKPHRASWCYVGWVGMVTAPSACGHRSRVAPRHIWKGNMTGRVRLGRDTENTGWLIPRERARNACGGRPGTITRLPGLPQYPWAPSRTDVPRREFPRHPTHRVLRELAPC